MPLIHFLEKLLISFYIVILCWQIKDNNAYHLNDHYSICLSPEFNDWQRESIDNGIDLWNGMGKTRFYSGTGSTCDILVVLATGSVATMIEHKTKDPRILGYADLDGHIIYLLMDKVYDAHDLTYLSAHEAGHFLAQEHIPMSRLAVMNPYRRYYGSGPPHLFRADLEQYCHHQKCSNVDWAHTDDVVYSMPDAGIELDLDTILPIEEHNGTQ